MKYETCGMSCDGKELRDSTGAFRNLLEVDRKLISKDTEDSRRITKLAFTAHQQQEQKINGALGQGLRISHEAGRKMTFQVQAK